MNINYNDIVKYLYPGEGWFYEPRNIKRARSIYRWALELPALPEEVDIDKLVRLYYHREKVYLARLVNSSNYSFLIDLVSRIIVNKVDDIKELLYGGVTVDEMCRLIELAGIIHGKETTSQLIIDEYNHVKSYIKRCIECKDFEWDILSKGDGYITLHCPDRNWVENFKLREEVNMENLKVGQVVKYRSNSTDLIHKGKIQAFTTDGRIVVMNTSSNVTVLVSPSSIIEEPEKFEHGRMYEIVIEHVDCRNAIAIDSIKGMVLIYSSVILEVNPIIEANIKLSRVRDIGMATLK